MRQIAPFTGGRFQHQPGEVFDPGGRSLPARLRLWPALLALALVRNFLEALCRRFRRGMPAAAAAVPRAA